jgi:hypothetical protein
MSVIFNRAMFGLDVATGKTELAETPDYHSKGKPNIRDVRNKLPDPIENICYVLQPLGTCNDDQMEALADGTAETENWVVVKPVGAKGERLGGDDGDDEGKDGQNEFKDGDTGKSSGSAKLSATLFVGLVPIVALTTLW